MAAYGSRKKNHGVERWWDEIRRRRKKRATSSPSVQFVCAHWPYSSVLNFRFFVHFLICYVLFSLWLSLLLWLSCEIKIVRLNLLLSIFFFRLSVTLNLGNMASTKNTYMAHMNAKKNKGWNTCWKNKGPLRKIASLNYFFYFIRRCRV